MKKFVNVLLTILLILAIVPQGAIPARAAAEAREMKSGGFVMTASAEDELIQFGGFSDNYTKPRQSGRRNAAAKDTVYNKIYQGLLEKAEKISFTLAELGIDETLTGNALMAEISARTRAAYIRVLNDSPELYFVKNSWSYGYEYRNGSLVPYLLPGYFPVTESQQAQFDSTVDSIVKEGSQLKTELEKALFVHDYLAVNCQYDWDVSVGKGASDQAVFNAYGVLVNRNAVCQGYAMAYILLMRRLGVECCYVGSEAMNHGWNLIQIGGSWYHVDVTWDDPVPNTEGKSYHRNFLVSDSGIRQTGHTGWNETDLPKASSTYYESDNWAFHNVLHPLYCYKNGWYYLDSIGNYSVYRTDDLSKRGTKISNNLQERPGGYSWDPNCGIAWQGDKLYFLYLENASSTSSAMRLSSYSLEEDAVLWLTEPFTFVPTASQDGNFESGYDQVGLRLDAENEKLQAISSNRRAILSECRLQNFPSGWAQIQTDTVELAGFLDGEEKLGFVLGDRAPKRFTLYVSYYQGAKMTGMKEIPVENNGAGIYVIPMPEDPPQHTRLKVLALDGAAYAPFCPALAA